MTEPITIEQLKNASLDAKTLEEVVNGDENSDVTSRLGATYPTLDRALKMLLENGLLGATPFATYQAMTASNLNDDSYAVVTDDANKNGIYHKKGGQWVLSGYNETIGKLAQNHLSAIQALASRTNTYPIAGNNLNLAWGVVDANNKVGIGVTQIGDVITASSTIASADSDYAFAITDSDNKIAFAITNTGEIINAKDDVNLYVDDGDIYAIQGNHRTRLTDSGDNQAPILQGNAVRFVSKRLGDYNEYLVNLDGSGVSRYFATNKKYEQVIITGQSLAQGGANQAITTTAPYPNHAHKFSNGPVGNGDAGEIIKPDIKPLAEEINETIATGFAKKLLTQKLDRTLLMSGQAHGGQVYNALKKGGTRPVYQQCINQVAYGSYLGGGSHVRAICVIHGEGDGNQGNQNYDKNLREWLDDFNADIKATNGQTDNVVMLTCQTSSASGYKSASARDQFTTPFLQLKASIDNPDIILVTPKYQMTYVDYAHIDAQSTRLLGEYFAKVYRHAVINGKKWRPMQPKNIAKLDNKIVIDFIVPKPPIVFDTIKVVENASNTHKGFVLKNADGVMITDVAITSDTQITITTNRPVPQGATLSYAFDNGVQGKAGASDGARGNVRDSDDSELSAYTGEPLYNWLVIFKHTF